MLKRPTPLSRDCSPQILAKWVGLGLGNEMKGATVRRSRRAVAPFNALSMLVSALVTLTPVGPATAPSP